jgi:hypothetical protein
LRITGTFIDEITHDIPSQNWGYQEWDREFELYRRIGIDAVIVIRAGYRDRCIYPSRAIPDLLPVYEDLGSWFFELAERHGLGVWLGLYDSGVHWHRGSWWREVELNRAFIEEAAARYGTSPAFAGWYVCHETSRWDVHIDRLFRELGTACRIALDRPVLISPFPQGAKQFAANDVFTLEESLEHWDRIFGEARGAIDVCAFQDGQIHYRELPAFHAGIAELGRRHGIKIWSNVETFDRDMPIKFPPADWRLLRLKLDEAARWAEKIITFEFAHFLSPHSSYPSAHHLFARYAQHFGVNL